MGRWYIKQFRGLYLKAWTRFTCIKYADGTPDWKYHTKLLHFSESREEAKKFDKEKTAIKFIRGNHELRKLLESGEIMVREE